MDSPISSITAEIFLQQFEDRYIKQLLDTKKIVLYTRYVDDILIMYDAQRIHHTTINTYINQVHENLTLNPTYEHNTNINCRHLTITLKPTQHDIDIFCKPTTTDTTNNFGSNRPIEHKMVAFRYTSPDSIPSLLHKK
jgi:hypothetical protein